MLTRYVLIASVSVVSIGARADKVTINGSGSTFQKAYQEVAIDLCRKSQPGVVINYGGGGSGKGRQDLADQVVDFAGSDAPFRDGERGKLKGGAVLYFPILLGPVAISYNVPGLVGLRLSARTLARIFQGDIRSWDDPQIADDNPGTQLPRLRIVVARRADGSGTTENFTKYLATAAHDEWKLGSGPSVTWPVDTQAGQGNSGVALIVKSTRGAIGYVDLSDAKASGLAIAKVKNLAGYYIEPSVDSAAAAGNGAAVRDDLVFSALNSADGGAYPITYQSWVIVYTRQGDGARGRALKQYLRFLLAEGQSQLKELDYAPLPPAIRARALRQLEQVVVP